MALARALTAVRTGVLSHLRVPASFTATQHQAGPASWLCARGFAGTYLDKNEVTERILNVVKNFDKVDQSKARPLTYAEVFVCMLADDRFPAKLLPIQLAQHSSLFSKTHAVRLIAGHS